MLSLFLSNNKFYKSSLMSLIHAGMPEWSKSFLRKKPRKESTWRDTLKTYWLSAYAGELFL